jgi:hypothetical protein
VKRKKPILVTRQLEVSASGLGYIQLLGTDETIFIHIGYVHMTAVSNKARVQNR